MIFNLFLLFDVMLNVGKTAFYQRHCDESDKRYIRPVTTFYHEGYACKNGQRIPEGDLMFAYYGEDSDCWTKESQYEMQKCFDKTPYGGPGTLEIGGNYIMDGAGYIETSSDGAGIHWLMTTTTEPMGNVIGLKREDGGIIFGDNAVAKGDLKLSETDKELQIGDGSFYVNTGKNTQMVPGVGKKEVDHLDFDSDLSIFSETVCGGSNSCEEAGDNYRYKFHRADFNGILKFHDTGYLCKDTLSGYNISCYPYEYRVENIWNFYDKYNNKDEEFVKYNCAFGSGICSPQPYVQYKIMDYKAESNTSGRVSGVEGRVRCMKENCTDCRGEVFVEKPERRENVSCKACGDTDNSFPFGCN